MIFREIKNIAIAKKFFQKKMPREKDVEQL